MTSPGALALRLGVRVLAMPDGTTLRFHAPGVEQVQKISGAEVKASLRRNFDAGEGGEEAETFWSPVIEGEAVTLEIELPASIDPDEVDITLPRISHLFQLPYSSRTNDQTGIAEKAAAACNQDVMCDSAWDTQSRATARMLYTKSGSSYLCTGTLLNDTDTSTFIPYFLAANHCVSTQTAASSLQTYWSGVQPIATAVCWEVTRPARVGRTSFMPRRRRTPVLCGSRTCLPAGRCFLVGTPLCQHRAPAFWGCITPRGICKNLAGGPWIPIGTAWIATGAFFTVARHPPAPPTIFQ